MLPTLTEKRVLGNSTVTLEAQEITGRREKPAELLMPCTLPSSVPEEKYLTLEGFHKFVIDRAKQDIRSVWRAILSCGYDLHFER